MSLPTQNLSEKSICQLLGVASPRAIFYSNANTASEKPKTLVELGQLVSQDGLSATYNAENTPALRLAGLLNNRNLSRFKGYEHIVLQILADINKDGTCEAFTDNVILTYSGAMMTAYLQLKVVAPSTLVTTILLAKYVNGKYQAYIGGRFGYEYTLPFLKSTGGFDTTVYFPNQSSIGTPATENLKLMFFDIDLGLNGDNCYDPITLPKSPIKTINLTVTGAVEV